jgi:hypothetical protein
MSTTTRTPMMVLRLFTPVAASVAGAAGSRRLEYPLEGRKSCCDS